MQESSSSARPPRRSLLCAAAGAVVVALLFLRPVGGSHEQCRSDCTLDPPARPLARPGQPPAPRPHPYAVAPAATPHAAFCQLGCTHWYSRPTGVVTNVSCKAQCDEVYRYNLSTGYSHLAEVARWECRDGCDLGLLRCQAGYECAEGRMQLCPPGTWRDGNFSTVAACHACPKGSYRAQPGGVAVSSCLKCPPGFYLNATRTADPAQCRRCPDGTFAHEAGMDVCKCITSRSCLPEWQNYQHDSVPYIGRW